MELVKKFREKIPTQVSGMMTPKAWGEIEVENFKSSYDLPVAKKRRVAVSLSWGEIAFRMTVSCLLINGVNSDNNSK